MWRGGLEWVLEEDPFWVGSQLECIVYRMSFICCSKGPLLLCWVASWWADGYHNRMKKTLCYNNGKLASWHVKQGRDGHAKPRWEVQVPPMGKKIIRLSERFILCRFYGDIQMMSIHVICSYVDSHNWTWQNRVRILSGFDRHNWTRNAKRETRWNI